MRKELRSLRPCSRALLPLSMRRRAAASRSSAARPTYRHPSRSSTGKVFRSSPEVRKQPPVLRSNSQWCQWQMRTPVADAALGHGVAHVGAAVVDRVKAAAVAEEGEVGAVDAEGAAFPFGDVGGGAQPVVFQRGGSGRVVGAGRLTHGQPPRRGGRKGCSGWPGLRGERYASNVLRCRWQGAVPPEPAAGPGGGASPGSLTHSRLDPSRMRPLFGHPRPHQEGHP